MQCKCIDIITGFWIRLLKSPPIFTSGILTHDYWNFISLKPAQFTIMKKIILSIILFIALFLNQLKAQENKSVIYNPQANAAIQIDEAVAEAKKSGKHVLLQIGGNWCPWCIRLHQYINADSEIDSLLHTDYVFVLLNYSKENKNMDILERFGFPQRFGFPVLVVLDKDGRKLHTQNTAYLEQEKSYNRKLLIEFLKQWNKLALKTSKYMQ